MKSGDQGRSTSLVFMMRAVRSRPTDAFYCRIPKNVHTGGDHNIPLLPRRNVLMSAYVLKSILKAKKPNFFVDQSKKLYVLVREDVMFFSDVYPRTLFTQSCAVEYCIIYCV